MTRSVGRVCAGFYLAVSLVASYILLGSPLALPEPGLGDLPYFLLLGIHFLWGVVLLLSSTEYRRFSRGALRRLVFVPEILGAASLLFFLFSYIFATNANMDYVQRFIESGGNLRLALDTDTERLYVWVRLFPFVAVDLGAYLFLRIGRYRAVLASGRRATRDSDRIVRPWAFLIVLAGAFMTALAQPSFAVLDGIPILGWVALVPLFLVWRTSRVGHGIFYGVVFGSVSTILSNYWLGTFSLVSLQITVLFFLLYYLLFSSIVIPLYRTTRWAKVLVFPLAMTVFEYLRSIGFLGYPWALAAHTQYSFVPIIQLASLTGVWGISLVVLLGNSAIAEFLGAVFTRVSMRREVNRGQPDATVRRSFGWLTGVAALVGGVVLAGSIVIATNSDPPQDARMVRMALLQQSTDPRKHTYEQTLGTLTTLTHEALQSDPDIIVWSETAFVPNIRRWSTDTSSRRYHTLVTEFLEFQSAIQTWLLTGNDDYEITRDAGGEITQRLEYNASVLFSDRGEREETYRKIQLVPFTEHFPYQDELPWLYELLQDFDVHFWEPGDVFTVFEHPLVKFSTPICYEDVFPNHLRKFVVAGAEAIVNISNDFWSLTEVQAKQHFVAALFRSVENRRPVLRATASGLTGQIDAYGRIIATGPYYEPAYVMADVALDPDPPLTFYTRVGDYFPSACGALLVIIWTSSLVATAGNRTRRRQSQASQAVEPATRPAPASPPAAGPPTSSDDESDQPRRRKRRRKPKTNWRAIWDG